MAGCSRRGSETPCAIRGLTMATLDPERLADGIWRGLVSLGERCVKPHLVGIVSDALDALSSDSGEELDARDAARVERWFEGQRAREHRDRRPARQAPVARRKRGTS